MSQSYEHLEIVVCDDSLDDTIKGIVDELTPQSTVPLLYVRNQRRLGFVGNLLECLGHAQGQYIKFLCDDDRLFPNCIAEQAQVLTTYEEVSLAVGQRFFCDCDDIQLPARLENTPLSSVSVLLHGSDLLSMLEPAPRNFIGGLSSALMRRVDVQDLLPVLVQPEQGFVALLDLVLFVCLLKRGELAYIASPLSAERLHAERLGSQQVVKELRAVEVQWLQAMLKGRSGQPAPAKGWVRYVPLTHARLVPRKWEELPLARALGDLQATLPFLVGSDAHSFVELYRQWLECRTLSPADKRILPDVMSRWAIMPKIVAVVLDEQGGSARLGMTVDSLAKQHYPAELTLVLSVDCEEAHLDGRVFTLPLRQQWVQALNELLEQIDGADWVYLLRTGDRVIDSALLCMAERINQAPHARCFYSDEGGLLAGESVEPIFKPDFNLDLLRNYPYVGRALAFQRRAILKLGGFDSDAGDLAPHDVLWRLVEHEGADCIGHISEILVESACTFKQWLAEISVIEGHKRVLQAHLGRLGIEHRLVPAVSWAFDHIEYVQHHKPLVSIIVHHKDQLRPLRRCIESLLEKTDYPRYEVLILDHGSVEPTALNWLSGMEQIGGEKVRVLQLLPTENLAAVRNAGAAAARGEYLIMLDPLTVVTQPGWVQELVNQGCRPEVAVVGAKLFSPRGYVRHAGLILGFRGAVGGMFQGESLHSEGYMQRLQVVQDLSAVGPDCLMVRKQVFDDLAGLDETIMTPQLSHTDYCLRVRELGYLVVWTPQAQVALTDNAAPQYTIEHYHQEQSDQAMIYGRWLSAIARDPAYNPNLRLTGASYSLEPGLRRGWSPLSNRQLPNVLAIPVNTTAVGHYRVTQPFLELEAAGRIVGKLSYDMPSLVDLERQSPDVIILQGRYIQSTIDQVATLKSYSSARRIFELDDYVISVPQKNDHTRNMPKDMERLVRLGTSLCDRVVVSTQPLADALSSMHGDIRVVPNMLAAHLWENVKSRRRTSSKARVGWGGGTSHAGDLELIAEVVRQLADQVEWVFFGMCPSELLPYVHEFHPAISLHAYPAKLASLNLDLALAPLEYHIFNDCKSNLRLLEYGACGYPVVCSDTLAYRGYLPCTRVRSNSTADWLEAIRMHLADPDASYRMGDELRAIVRRDWMLRGDNLQHWVNGWLAD